MTRSKQTYSPTHSPPITECGNCEGDASARHIVSFLFPPGSIFQSQLFHLLCFDDDDDPFGTAPRRSCSFIRATMEWNGKASLVIFETSPWNFHHRYNYRYCSSSKSCSRQGGGREEVDRIEVCE